MSPRNLRFLPAALAAFVLVPAAQADLLVNPTGGTVVFDSTGNHDDEVSLQSLGGSFQFYGTSYSSLYVSTNGNLNPTGINSYSNVGLDTAGFAMIAPLWDDLYIYQGTTQSITQKTSAGLYTATWDMSIFSNSTPHETFQASLFSTSQTVKGFQFLPGDIAFSYSTIQTPFRNSDATVGLGNGTGGFATVAPLAGTAGLLTDSQAGNLPLDTRFILFRVNGNGGYNVSIENTVQSTPEPASLAVLGLGALGLVRRRARRK